MNVWSFTPFTFHSVIPETAAFIHEWFHSGTTRWTSGGGYGGGKGAKPGGADVDDDADAAADGKALKIASSKHLKGVISCSNRVNVT